MKLASLASLVVIGAAMLLPDVSNAQTFAVLHNFSGYPDGAAPDGLVLDRDKDILYGTTIYGGLPSSICNNFRPDAGCGTVFQIDVKLHEFAADGTEGAWPERSKFTTLHEFAADGTEGAWPYRSLVVGYNDDLYGSTSEGGSSACGQAANGGCGTVFKIDPTSGEITTLHRFSYSSGSEPTGIAFDHANGKLYRTAANGGAGGNGIVFSLDPTTGTFETLHSFTVSDNGGAGPVSGVIIDDPKKILYGTTFYGGGDASGGTVFKIDLKTGFFASLLKLTGGGLNGVVLHKGILYGTTGNNLFKLDPDTGILTTLHTFNGTAEGAYPTL